MTAFIPTASGLGTQRARPEAEILLPPRLKSLAALLGSVLGGPMPSPIDVDEALVRMAIHRHQVGPLLHAALVRRTEPVAGDLMCELAASRRRNDARRAVDLARLQNIEAIFASRGIAWMSLKGTLQAARLYGDPALRQSSDIDLLVAPGDFACAVSALAEAGYIPSNPPAPAGIAGACILAAVRDISLIACDDHRCAIDLHRRLFLTGSARSGCPQLTADSGCLPAPRFDAELACYLIMHGAQSYWVRLKWLVDLVPLLAALNDADKQTLMLRAREMGVDNSVAASLLLLRHLFSFARFGALASWLDSREHRPAVRRRLERYVRMIGVGRDWKRSPLDNARVTMEAYLSLFESPWTRARMIPAALLSSFARRAAGAIWPERRKLTRGDAPPAG